MRVTLRNLSRHKSISRDDQSYTLINAEYHRYDNNWMRLYGSPPQYQYGIILTFFNFHLMLDWGDIGWMKEVEDD